MKTENIRKLFDAMSEGGFQFLEMKSSEFKVKLILEPPAPAPLPSKPSLSETSIKEEPKKDNIVKIFSERVGVFAFGKTQLQVGMTVKKGEILGIIKGISIQDQVPAPQTGKLQSINIKNGDIVEFSRLLFTLLPEPPNP